jgi:hypothetical protein
MNEVPNSHILPQDFLITFFITVKSKVKIKSTITNKLSQAQQATKPLFRITLSELTEEATKPTDEVIYYMVS